MNYINILHYADLDQLLNIDILITGDVSRHKEELEDNTWILCFDAEFIKTLTLNDLQIFINNLIKNRSQQVIDINNGPATFYFWYDEQSFNLGFDILSGTNIQLPFGCKLNILNNPLTILNKFLQDTQADTNDLSWENITILNPGDPGYDDDDDDGPEWIQNVYVTTLPQTTISNIINKIIS